MDGTGGSREINTCCICGTSLVEHFRLSFRDLLGSGESVYRQRLGLCPQCGFICTINPFTSEQLENRYKQMSKFEYNSNAYVLNLSEHYKRQSLRQKFFIDSILGAQNYDSILEVGASSGYNLSLYVDKRRMGIEPSSINCKLAEKYYGLTLFNGMYEEYNSKEKFDVIFLSMVLEHIVNPFAFIESLKGICNKYIFIEVPILDYKIADEPYGMFCEEHVNIFTIASLWNLMSYAGFEYVESEMIFNYGAYLPAGYPSIASLWKINNSSQAFATTPKAMFSNEELLSRYIEMGHELLKDVEKRIIRIPHDENLAIWGIGHHVSMLLANTSLNQKNIVRVYDSDEKKHGLKLIDCEIQPFQEKDVVSGTIDSILITTYTAQKAILRTLETCKNRPKVYTLYDI